MSNPEEKKSLPMWVWILIVGAIAFVGLLIISFLGEPSLILSTMR
jgi:hypothetical protein